MQFCFHDLQYNTESGELRRHNLLVTTISRHQKLLLDYMCGGYGLQHEWNKDAIATAIYGELSLEWQNKLAKLRRRVNENFGYELIVDVGSRWRFSELVCEFEPTLEVVDDEIEPVPTVVFRPNLNRAFGALASLFVLTCVVVVWSVISPFEVMADKAVKAERVLSDYHVGQNFTSKDGFFVYERSQLDGGNAVVLHPHGGGEPVFLNSDFSVSHPDFSPSSKRVVYRAEQNGSCVVRLMQLADDFSILSDDAVISCGDGAFKTMPQISANGLFVFFSKSLGGVETLFRHNLQNNVTTQVSSPLPSGQGDIYFKLAKDDLTAAVVRDSALGRQIIKLDIETGGFVELAKVDNFVRCVDWYGDDVVFNDEHGRIFLAGENAPKRLLVKADVSLDCAAKAGSDDLLYLFDVAPQQADLIGMVADNPNAFVISGDNFDVSRPVCGSVRCYYTKVADGRTRLFQFAGDFERELVAFYEPVGELVAASDALLLFKQASGLFLLPLDDLTADFVQLTDFAVSQAFFGCDGAIFALHDGVVGQIDGGWHNPIVGMDNVAAFTVECAPLANGDGNVLFFERDAALFVREFDGSDRLLDVDMNRVERWSVKSGLLLLERWNIAIDSLDLYLAFSGRFVASFGVPFAASQFDSATLLPSQTVVFRQLLSSQPSLFSVPVPTLVE